MKTTKVEGGTLYENDSLIPEGIYIKTTQLKVLQPGESYLDPTPSGATDPTGAVAAIAAAITNGD